MKQLNCQFQQKTKTNAQHLPWRIHLTVRHLSKSGGRARVTITYTLLPAITIQRQGDDRGAKGKVIFFASPSLPASISARHSRYVVAPTAAIATYSFRHLLTKLLQ